MRSLTGGTTITELVIDASGPRTGKTQNAVRTIADDLDESPTKDRGVVFILPRIGEPLQGEGLAKEIRVFVQNEGIDLPIIGRFGRSKTCRRLAEGDEPAGRSDDDAIHCGVCPQRRARNATSVGDFWTDDWLAMVGEEPPEGCPRDHGRFLAYQDEPAVVITTAQSLRHPSRGARDALHLTRDDLRREVARLCTNQICVFDEFHNLDTLYVLDEIKETQFPAPSDEGAWTLQDIRDALDGMTSPTSWDDGDALPDDPASLEVMVRRWVLYNVDISIRTYLDHHADVPKYWLAETTERLKWVREFENRIQDELGACRYRNCRICNLRQYLQDEEDENHPWTDFGTILSKLKAGEAVFLPRPAGGGEVMEPSEFDKDTHKDTRWEVELRVLDATRPDEPNRRRCRPVIQHTTLQAIADVAERLHLLSATPPKEPTLRNALGDHYTPMDTMQDPPELSLLVERRVRGQKRLWGPDKWWAEQSAEKFRKEFLDPLVRDRDHPPFVVARSKREMKQFQERFSDHPDDLLHWARGTETEGVGAGADHVLLLGPPKIPPTVSDAIFYTLPWEKPDDEPGPEELSELNKELRKRSMVEALVQAAARTGSHDEPALCIVMGCHERDVEDLEQLEEEFPWFDAESMVFPWPSRDVLEGGFQGQVPYEGRYLQAHDFLQDPETPSLDLTPD